MWRNVVEETNNRDPKGDKVPLGDNRGATHGKRYLRSLIWLGLMFPPFWFSTLKYKKATLILLEGNSRTSYLKRKRDLSYPPSSHKIVTLDFTTCNMEGHVKLFDRLSGPSDRLIHQISHPSKEQTLVEPNLSCFICIWVLSGFVQSNTHLPADLNPPPELM